MSQINIKFLFDFGSPNAYLCHKVIPQIENRTGEKFVYTPILLGGLFKLSNNRSPAESNAEIPLKRAYDALEIRRFVEKNGITEFKRNPFFPVNTLLLMRGAVAARQVGCFESYIDAVFSSMWERQKKMDDPEVVFEELAATGLDAPLLMELSQSTEIKNALVMNTQSAHELGAFGSPTFFVEGEMFFGKDRLNEVEEQISKIQALKK